MDEAEVFAEIHAHEARNFALLDSLREESVDMDVPRPSDHSFYAPDRESAENLVIALRRLGLEVSKPQDEGRAEDRLRWSVEAIAQWSPTRIMDRSTVELLVRTAAAVDGVYDGWGTSC